MAGTCLVFLKTAKCAPLTGHELGTRHHGQEVQALGSECLGRSPSSRGERHHHALPQFLQCQLALVTVPTSNETIHVATPSVLCVAKEQSA